MLKYLFLGPLILGIWFMYKGARDLDAWRSVRAAWFAVGLLLFTGGIWLTFVAIGQVLVEVAADLKQTDAESRNNNQPSAQGYEPTVLDTFGSGTVSVPQTWKNNSTAEENTK